MSTTLEGPVCGSCGNSASLDVVTRLCSACFASERPRLGDYLGYYDITRTRTQSELLQPMREQGIPDEFWARPLMREFMRVGGEGFDVETDYDIRTREQVFAVIRRRDRVYEEVRVPVR